MNRRPTTPTQRGLGYAVFARLAALLLKRPHTARSLARAARVSETAARRFLAAMHEEGAAYVCAFGRGRGNRLGARMFAIGNEPDVPKPVRLSNAERMRRYRQRRRTLPGAWPVSIGFTP